MIHKKCPATAGGGDAGECRGDYNPNAATDRVQGASECAGHRTIESLSDDFLVRTFGVERQCVAAGWFDPVGLHDSAHRHNLCGNTFADKRCGFVHAYVATVAERRTKPNVVECLAVAELHWDIPLDRLDWGWLDLLILTEEIDLGRIDEYAHQVALLTDIRENTFRHHLAELAKLCIDENRFRIVVHDRHAVALPKLVPHTRTRIPDHVCV